MAAAGVAAVGAALGGVASAFGNQSRASAGAAPPRVDTSTAAIALARDPKMARQLRKNARDERILALVTDPQVMGLLVTFGGLAAASRIPFHPDPDTNARVQGLAAAAAVLMGLGLWGWLRATSGASVWLTGGGGVVLGAAAYWLVALMLGAPEARQLPGMVLRRTMDGGR